MLQTVVTSRLDLASKTNRTLSEGKRRFLKSWFVPISLSRSPLRSSPVARCMWMAPGTGKALDQLCMAPRHGLRAPNVPIPGLHLWTSTQLQTSNTDWSRAGRSTLQPTVREQHSTATAAWSMRTPTRVFLWGPRQVLQPTRSFLLQWPHCHQHLSQVS